MKTPISGGGISRTRFTRRRMMQSAAAVPLAAQVGVAAKPTNSVYARLFPVIPAHPVEHNSFRVHERHHLNAVCFWHTKGFPVSPGKAAVETSRAIRGLPQ